MGFCSGQTALAVAVDGALVAVVALFDVAKPEAKGHIFLCQLTIGVAYVAAAVVHRLQSMGIEVWMCTGDNGRTASAVGSGAHRIVLHTDTTGTTNRSYRHSSMV